MTTVQQQKFIQTGCEPSVLHIFTQSVILTANQHQFCKILIQKHHQEGHSSPNYFGSYNFIEDKVETNKGTIQTILSQ